MNNVVFPDYVKVALWSYDTSKLDLSSPAHRAIIARNILNHGVNQAISWLRENFSKEEIAEVIRESSVSIWNKKSLALWSLIFNAKPIKQSRFS